MVVSEDIVRSQIAHVQDSVGIEHLSWATKKYIEGLEKDLERGTGVTQQELVRLMSCMNSDLRFKENGR